ncbi:transmembrane protein 255B-like [Glandiceps talaboti]
MPRQRAIQTNVVQRHCKAYEQKQRNAMIACVCQIVISLISLAFGISIYVTVENIRLGAFWPAIGFIIGAALCMAGVYLKGAGKSWMVAGVVFICFGIAMAFIGAIVDGVGAGLVARTDFSQCVYKKSGGNVNCPEGSSGGFLDLFGTETCSLKVPAKTCYCCYLYAERNCETLSFSLSAQPYKYEGVKGCWEIEHTYNNLLWSSVACNVISFFVGVVCAALVCAFKSTIEPVVVAQQQIVGHTGGIATTVITQNQVAVPVPAPAPVVIYNTAHPQYVGFSPAATAITPPPQYQPNPPYMQAPPPHGMPAPRAAAYAQPSAPPSNQMPYGGERPPPYSL